MDINALKAPFPAEIISWRVGATNKKKNNGVATKGIALAYIDARDVMQRLDDVCGIENWQCEHPHANGKTSCRIGIKINNEWVWKENGAGDSAMDAEKGAFSDSFKRAAVLWGIGRYLYDVPNVWVEVDEWGGIKDPADKKLMGALRMAEKGIRSNIKETKSNDGRKFVSQVKAEIEAAPTEEDIAFVIHKYVGDIETCSEAQKKYINECAHKAKEKLNAG